jgi:hypothetical protein
MWTSFFDMSSGGGSKEDWNYILIELPQDQAEVYFYNRFGHNPHRISCTCCGSDYSVHEYETLEDALKAYSGHYTNLIISKDEIDPEMVKGNIPRQGYYWIDED